MRIQLLMNGDLEMQATPKERSFIRKLTKLTWLNGYGQEAAFIAHVLRPYEQTSPTSIGALTSAPCITDGINNWGFMNYQVESFLETLGKGEKVVWTCGNA